MAHCETGEREISTAHFVAVQIPALIYKGDRGGRISESAAGRSGAAPALCSPVKENGVGSGVPPHSDCRLSSRQWRCEESFCYRRSGGEAVGDATVLSIRWQVSTGPGTKCAAPAGQRAVPAPWRQWERLGTVSLDRKRRWGREFSRPHLLKNGVPDAYRYFTAVP